MSRSIHATNRDLREIRRSDYADAKHYEAELHRLEQRLHKKRRVKRHSGLERGKTDEPLQHTAPESVPVTVRDGGGFVHYPASPDDLLAVMRALPHGVVDGLASVSLELGMAEQARRADCELFQDEPDLLVGRLGFEMLPGVYSGRIMGVYTLSSCAIRVFAYVYDPAVLDLGVWEVYLRLRMLSTFVH